MNLKVETYIIYNAFFFFIEKELHKSNFYSFFIKLSTDHSSIISTAIRLIHAQDKYVINSILTVPYYSCYIQFTSLDVSVSTELLIIVLKYYYSKLIEYFIILLFKQFHQLLYYVGTY